MRWSAFMLRKKLTKGGTAFLLKPWNFFNLFDDLCWQTSGMIMDGRYILYTAGEGTVVASILDDAADSEEKNIKKPKHFLTLCI